MISFKVDRTLRHILDQYEQPENLLTPPPEITLDRDTAMLGAFSEWLGVPDAPMPSLLSKKQKPIPGTLTDEAEQSHHTIPFVPAIFQEENWAALFKWSMQARIAFNHLDRVLSNRELSPRK
jgi:hypothetical protein